MKKQKSKIILFMITICFLSIFLFQTNKIQEKTFQDDIIFFKWFFKQNDKKETKSNEIYHLKVDYKQTNSKKVHLADTLKKETLIYEKIAPGTKGEFEILLETNEKINYQIKFESQTPKPQNLEFQIQGKNRKYRKLEDMQTELKGEINENKRIKIHWEWQYEKDEIQDKQDTYDGKNIKQYNFTILAIGT